MSWVNKHAKELTLVFGGLVAVASALTLASTFGEDNHPPLKSEAKPLKQKRGGDGGPKKDVREWTREELKYYLEQRYVYPPEEATTEQLVSLVESYRNA